MGRDQRRRGSFEGLAGGAHIGRENDGAVEQRDRRRIVHCGFGAEPHGQGDREPIAPAPAATNDGRSEENTSELQSLMRTSYAVFCLKKKKNKHTIFNYIIVIVQ